MDRICGLFRREFGVQTEMRIRVIEDCFKGRRFEGQGREYTHTTDAEGFVRLFRLNEESHFEGGVDVFMAFRYLLRLSVRDLRWTVISRYAEAILLYEIWIIMIFSI